MFIAGMMVRFGIIPIAGIISAVFRLVPSFEFNIAIENGPFIVDLPII